MHRILFEAHHSFEVHRTAAEVERHKRWEEVHRTAEAVVGLMEVGIARIAVGKHHSLMEGRALPIAAVAHRVDQVVGRQAHHSAVEVHRTG